MWSMDSEVSSLTDAPAMPLDLSFGEEDNDGGDVIVTMAIPARQHWKRNRRHSRSGSDVVIVPSDSEDDGENDVAIVSITESSTNELETDDCVIESFQPAEATSRVLTIVPLDEASSAAGANTSLQYTSCCQPSFVNSSPDSCIVQDVNMSNPCRTDISLVVLSADSGIVRLNDGKVSNGIAFHDTSSTGVCSTAKCVIDPSSRTILPNNRQCDSNSIKFDTSILPVQRHGIFFDLVPKMSNSFANSPGFLCNSSSSSDHSGNTSAAQISGCVPESTCAMNSVNIPDDRLMKLPPVDPNICIFPSSASSGISSHNPYISVSSTGSLTPQSANTSSLCLSVEDSSGRLCSRASTQGGNSCSSFQPLSAVDTSQSSLQQAGGKSVYRARLPKRRSAGDAKIYHRHAAKCRRWTSLGADPGTACDTDAASFDAQSASKCCACGNKTEIERLSQCMAGHPCCGPCLQNQVKTLLASSTKGAVICMQSGCPAYYLATQLRNSLPAMVVEILEEKLDREYCDDVARLQSAQNCLPGLTTVGENAADRCLANDLKRDNDGLLDLPKNWEKMSENESYCRVDLDCDSEEYNWVSRTFYQTMSWSRSHIVRIQRVQNHALWQFFVVKRRQMQRESGSIEPVTEKHLFHGTSQSTIDAICANNFDWRLCGSHGTVYGQGSYFATEASYSHMYTDCVSGRPRPSPSLFGASLRLLPPPVQRRNGPMPGRVYDQLAGIFLHTKTGVTPGAPLSMSHAPGFPLPAHQPKLHVVGQHLLPQLQPAHQPTLVSRIPRILHPSSSAGCINGNGIPVQPGLPDLASAGPFQTRHTSSFQVPSMSSSVPGGVIGPCCNLSLSFYSQPVINGSHLAPVDPGMSHLSGASNAVTSQNLQNLAPCSCCPQSQFPPAAHRTVPAILPLAGCPAHYSTGRVHPFANGTPMHSHHVMFFARVLVGRSAVGRSEYRTPPPVDPSQPFGRCYDSCVNRPVNPSIYVIFNSSQCYPEYIIEYANNIQPTDHHI